MNRAGVGSFSSFFLSLPFSGAIPRHLSPPWGSPLPSLISQGLAMAAREGQAGLERLAFKRPSAWVHARLPMGTACHECPLLPSPN